MDIQELIDTLNESLQLQTKFARCVEITPDDVRGWLMGDEWYDPDDPDDPGIPPEPEYALVKDIDDDLLEAAIVMFCDGSDEVNEFKQAAAFVIARRYVEFARHNRECSF